MWPVSRVAQVTWRLFNDAYLTSVDGSGDGGGTGAGAGAGVPPGAHFEFARFTRAMRVVPREAVGTPSAVPGVPREGLRAFVTVEHLVTLVGGRDAAAAAARGGVERSIALSSLSSPTGSADSYDPCVPGADPYAASSGGGGGGAAPVAGHVPATEAAADAVCDAVLSAAPIPDVDAYAGADPRGALCDALGAGLLSARMVWDVLVARARAAGTLHTDAPAAAASTSTAAAAAAAPGAAAGVGRCGTAGAAAAAAAPEGELVRVRRLLKALAVREFAAHVCVARPPCRPRTCRCLIQLTRRRRYATEPRLAVEPMRSDLRWLPWAGTGRVPDSTARAWSAGRTGYPLIDAALRQAASTG